MNKLSKLSFILFFLHLQCIVAQGPANVSSCSIWKKNATSKIIKDPKEINPTEFLNFNEGITISEDEQLIIGRTKLKSSFTLFVVFKSNEELEKDILKYRVGGQELNITNKKTKS